MTNPLSISDQLEMTILEVIESPSPSLHVYPIYLIARKLRESQTIPFAVCDDDLNALLISMQKSGLLCLWDDKAFGALAANITPVGLSCLRDLRDTTKSAEKLPNNKDTGISAPAPVSFDVRVSEAALDGWWEAIDYEIKAELFNHFWEPIEEEIEKEAAR